MIQHIKCLIFSLFVLSFSCKQEKTINKGLNKEQKITVEKNKQQDLVFSFYKSFISCESDIGYFSDEEAERIYANNKILIDLRNIKVLDFSKDRFSEEDILCIEKKLEIKITQKGIIKTNNDFPFDNVLLLNNQYAVISRDGHFFIFTEGAKKAEINNQPVSSSNHEFDDLYNTNLVGLSIINKEEKNIFKKYGIDFASNCMCNSPSIYVDKIKKEIILYNYCDVSKKQKDIKNKQILKISEIRFVGKELIFYTKHNINFIFKKVDENQILKLKVEGKISTNYIGNDLKLYYTSQPDKFQIEDCGDFDG